MQVILNKHKKKRITINQNDCRWVKLPTDLQEVLHSLWIITVTLSANSLHFFNLARLTSSLDVFEMDILILTEVHNGTQEVKQSWKHQNIQFYNMFN